VGGRRCFLPGPSPGRLAAGGARAAQAAGARADAPPNILMIGSDTLRADRLGALGYHRALTPNIDARQQGALFANCYVPCARTAPSLISMLTGTWPHTHGIRDNFVRMRKRG
jgi:arylsulfatase A-like enzyme